MKQKRRLKYGSHQPPSAKSVTLAPPPWDMGAEGPANRVGLIMEEAADINPATGKKENPNEVKRMRRVDMLAVWHKRETISTAGFNAAEKLRDAFLATQKAPGWPDNDRVQSSPKPDHAVTIQIDRLSRFAAIYAMVEARDRPIIDCCILHDHSPAKLVIDGRRPYYGPRHHEGLVHLRSALDRLARKMGA